MKRKKVFLILSCAACLLVATFLILRPRSAPLPENFSGFHVTKIDYRFFDQRIELENNAGRWQVVRFNGTPVVDARVSENRVRHLLDIFSGLTPQPARHVDGSKTNLEKLGFPRPPRLALKVVSSRGDDVEIDFGPGAGRKILAYFPLSNAFAFLSGSLLRFLQETPAAELRNRSVFTFELDDIEDFKTNGDCGAISLVRDGDRWVSNPPANAETLLSEILATPYLAEKSESPSLQAPYQRCVITLHGRKGRTETLSLVRDSQERLHAKNSALPSNYELPANFWARLKSR